MSKQDLSYEQLQEKEKELTEEIKKMELLINSSDTSTFEIMINNVKEEMQRNIYEEDWKALKNNKNKIEKFRDVVKIIQNQEELLDEKKEELEDIQLRLQYQQRSLLDDLTTPKETGFTFDNGDSISTGDVYSNTKETGEIEYFAVKESSEVDGAFCIVSNAFDGERMLQYPQNLNLLKQAKTYIGNIYIEDSDRESAVNALNIILGSEE